MSTPITVIIADDEAAIRNGLTQIVSSAPFCTRVLAATDNGKDALELLLHYKPEIAIMDINMPELNGLEVIKRSREQQLPTRFLILSGYADFSYAQTAIKYGVKSYFLKPLNLLEFRREFGQHCQEILESRNSSSALSPEELSSLMTSSRILFFNWLISGKTLTAEDISQKLSMLKPSVSDTPCCAVIFRPINSPGKQKVNLEQLKTEYLYPCFSSWPIEIWVSDVQLNAIVNLSEDNRSCFLSELTDCLQQLRHKKHINILAGIGNQIPSLQELSLSYSQAQEALTWHIYHTDQLIFDTGMISDTKPVFSREHLDFKPIIHGITHHNETEIRSWCQGLFHSLITPVLPPPNYLIGMCMYVIVNVQKQVLMLYPDQIEEFTFSYDEISSFESIVLLQQWLTDFFVRYSQMLKNTFYESNGIIKSAKEYIQNHLGDNLHARDVAAAVNLSESYFSIYFKDKTGSTLRDYILKVRMDYAKSRLLSGQVNINEIAYETGYQDYRSFSRAFKNETGLSPSEYLNGSDRKKL